MNRYAMIDGLRGIGAVAIAIYHIFRYGELPVAAQTVVPDVLQTCIVNGWMAVQWFFVIAGFAAVLATRSWQPAFGDALVHIVKRILRLGAAYWVAITFTALLTILAIEGWDDRTLNEAKPTPGQFLAHVFFLQDLLGYDCLNTGVWFIAIALQLDIAFIALLWLSHITAKRLERHNVTEARTWALAICFGPLAIWSLFWSMGDPATDVWFHHFFGMFLLGAIVGWTAVGRLSQHWFWGYSGLVVLQLATNFTFELSIALLAAMSIYACWRTGKLETWMNNRWLQTLGTLSYSLFVIHYPVSWIVGKVGYQLTGDHAWAAIGWLAASLLASLAAAWLLYHGVERPMLNKTRRLALPNWLAVRFTSFSTRASA